MSSAHRRGGQSQKLQWVLALWKREGIPRVRFQACHLARQDEDGNNIGARAIPVMLPLTP